MIGSDTVPLPLDPFLYQKPEWCLRCAGAQTFISVFEFSEGRYGYCLGCGEEKLIRFTRVSEGGRT